MFAKVFTLLACLALVQSYLIRVPLKKVKSATQTRKEPELNGNKRQSLLGKYQLDNYKASKFYGEMSFGTPPQTFKVLFDTGSWDSWVISSKCTDFDCQLVDRYFSNRSSTYMPNGTHVEIVYDFEAYSGILSSDNVQVGGITVTDQLFAEITSETSFGNLIDGILALAYQPFSANGVPTVLTNLFAQHTDLMPAFSFYLFKNSDGQTDGEMTIGGADPRYYKGDFLFAPVLKNQSYWMIQMDQVIVGSSLEVCEGSRLTVVDTGTSDIVAPSKELEKIYEAIGATLANNSDIYVLNCSKRSSLPDINFVVNGQNLTLTYEDYTYEDGDFGKCGPNFSELGEYQEEGINWILGNAFIQKFYTQFDLKNSRVGFAELK